MACINHESTHPQAVDYHAGLGVTCAQALAEQALHQGGDDAAASGCRGIIYAWPGRERTIDAKGVSGWTGRPTSN